VPITHERSPGRFDAVITDDWALFRGDDIIPAMNTGEAEDTYAVTTLEVALPAGWQTVRTGWPRVSATTFRIDNAERRFDRPTGWMIAGRVGTRTTKRAGTAITVAAPMGQHFRRMEVLTFLRFVWREVNEAFERTPDRLLVVGAGDPFWRGGLSASNSLFLHADRPLVSENGTSALLHELTHLVTRISGVVTATTNDDWIAEGLAEYYSFELLYRAHGISKSRRRKIIQWLSEWGSDVEHLRHSRSSGPITARAVVLFDQLDAEIRQRSHDRYSLDDVTRRLMTLRKVSLADLRRATADLVGDDVTALDSAVLR
jgi:predicted metalloprotease with PDZ domain